METLIIVIHLLVVVALVGVILIQRSEGGGLGIGGGSGFMTARGASNALTRTTAILAAVFFASSLALSLLARYGEKPIDILDRLPATTTQQQDGSDGRGVLDQLGGGSTAPADRDQAPTPPSGSDAAAPEAPAADEPAQPDQPAQPQVPNQ